MDTTVCLVCHEHEAHNGEAAEELINVHLDDHSLAQFYHMSCLITWYRTNKIPRYPPCTRHISQNAILALYGITGMEDVFPGVPHWVF